MKPKQPQIECPINWDILPEWAQFVSIDSTGEIFCWDGRPIFTNSTRGQSWDSKGEHRYLFVGTMMFMPDEFYALDHIWQREN
jgi:hypothetical protein